MTSMHISASPNSTCFVTNVGQRYTTAYNQYFITDFLNLGFNQRSQRKVGLIFAGRSTSNKHICRFLTEIRVLSLSRYQNLWTSDELKVSSGNKLCESNTSNVHQILWWFYITVYFIPRWCYPYLILSLFTVYQSKKRWTFFATKQMDSSKNVFCDKYLRLEKILCTRSINLFIYMHFTTLTYTQVFKFFFLNNCLLLTVDSFVK